MAMGWSMSELYSHSYSASIMEIYNITGKNVDFLIKIAQKYTYSIEYSIIHRDNPGKYSNDTGQLSELRGKTGINMNNS